MTKPLLHEDVEVTLATVPCYTTPDSHCPASAPSSIWRRARDRRRALARPDYAADRDA